MEPTLPCVLKVAFATLEPRRSVWMDFCVKKAAKLNLELLAVRLATTAQALALVNVQKGTTALVTTIKNPESALLGLTILLKPSQTAQYAH